MMLGFRYSGFEQAIAKQSSANMHIFAYSKPR